MRGTYDVSKGVRGKDVHRLDSSCPARVPSGKAMSLRPSLSHGHVSLVGDTDVEDEDLEDPMQWTPDNDPDQADYRAEQDEDEEEDDGADDSTAPGDTEGDTPRRPATVPGAVSALFADVRKRFSQVSQRPMPPSLARRRLVGAIFIHDDGRVKIVQ